MAPSFGSRDIKLHMQRRKINMPVLETIIARSLLKIAAVGFQPENPITFKSGIISPVYVDNRRFPFYPKEWETVIGGFQTLIEKDRIDFEVLAGIETAGIPHSAVLGYVLNKPSVFVRKKIKDHGTKSRIEGGLVKNKKVVLIEDLVTTGGSSLAGVEALRDNQAVVRDCLIIVSYGFKQATNAFENAGVKLHSLTNFAVILEEAVKQQLLNAQQKIILEDWFQDPWGWGKRHGHDIH
jgi:orotate phosphoribosyltransferase